MKESFGQIKGFFTRLSIAHKLLLGFLSISALLWIIAGFALTSLNKLNVLSRSILQTDIPVIEAAEKMIDAVFSEELYIQRYRILQRPEVLKMFMDTEKEFSSLVKKVKEVPEKRDFPIKKIEDLHKQYSGLLLKSINSTRQDRKGQEEQIRSIQQALITQIKEMARMARQDQNEKTGHSVLLGSQTYRIMAALCIFGILFSAFASLLITKNIASPLQELKRATEIIGEGNFDHRPDIKNRDEIGELSKAFVSMAQRLKRLEEMYLDASPLTRLPGGVAIENIMKKRVASGESFAFCLIDMDNFKAFNDRYGYKRGNDLIKALAEIIEEAVKLHGRGDDFVGHIGGDDFVVITTPERFRAICSYIIEEFDNEVVNFYDPEDKKRGYIVSKDRQGNERRFNIATVSIAVVTNTNTRFESHLEVSEIAAELKEYAKTFPRSLYVVDRRRSDSEPSRASEEQNKTQAKIIKLNGRARDA